MTNAIDIRDDGAMIVATVVLAECTPERALAAFTDPTILSRWWRGELTTTLRPGAPYTVAFPAIDATLTGQVISVDPARSLHFTWSWTDDDSPPSTVEISVTTGSEPGSVVLTVTHGPHSDDEAGKKAHQEHWEGWEFFLPRLATELQGP